MNAVLNFFDRSTALSYEPAEVSEHERRWASFQDWMQSIKSEELAEHMHDYLDQLVYAAGRVMSSIPASNGKATAVVEFKGWSEFEFWAFDNRWPGAKA